MAIRNESTVRSSHPVAMELGFVTVALAGVYLWGQVLRVASPPLSSALGGLPVGALAASGLFVAGLAVFAWAYVAARGLDVGLTFPSRADLPLVGLAVLVPVALVGATKLVGVLTGVPYSSLAMTYYGDTGLSTPVLTVVGLGLLVGVPTLVVVCQVLVQGSFRRVLGGDGAVVLTTLVAGFVMMSNTGGLATVPDRGKLLGAVLFVLALGVALYATEHVTREWLRYLAYVPVLLFVALVVLSGVAGIESVAGGLFAVTQLAVLGIAAYTYERTESLLVPALAYLGLSLAGTAVAVVLEAGVQPG